MIGTVGGKAIIGSPLEIEVSLGAPPPFGLELGLDWFKISEDVKMRPFKLLYDGQRDGFSNRIFHRKCDLKGPTVTVVTLTNGARFGGFNNASWGEKEGFYPSPGSFLFSLTDGEGSLPRKLPMIAARGSAVVSTPDYGPTFGKGFCHLQKIKHKTEFIPSFHL